MSRFDGLDDSSSASPHSKILTPCPSSRPKLIAFKSHNGKSILENSTLLIPFMDLISSGVVRRITSNQIAPIFHLIVQFSVKASKAKGILTNKGSMILEPTHFEWETNPIKCGSSLLIGAIASLQGEEVILREGISDSLSRKFNVPELGDLVFQLLKQSSLFRLREDIDPHDGGYPPRDLSVFPTLDDFSTPPPKPVNNHHTNENIESAGSMFPSPVSSLSMTSANDASARLLSVIRDPSKRFSSQIKELVKAHVSSELQALLKSINPSLIVNSSDKTGNSNDDDQFVGRGPPIRSHNHSLSPESHYQVSDTQCDSSRIIIHENFDEELRSRSRAYDSYTDPENYDSFNPFIIDPLTHMGEMIELENIMQREEVNDSLQAQLFYEESLPKTPISLSPPEDLPPISNRSPPHLSSNLPHSLIDHSLPHSSGNKRRTCVIRCKPMDMFVTQCEYCLKRFELCWMCIEDHIDNCYACKGLEAEALSTAALLKEHESLQMDLKIESKIAQESKEGLMLDYKSLEEYEKSFPPTPKDLALYTTVKSSCSMDKSNNLSTPPQDFSNDLFTGRGSHPLVPSPDIDKVFLAQLDIWSSPSEISVIIPECITLFDSISNAADGYSISYLFHKAAKAVQNILPHCPKSYKQALMGEFGGSGPHRGLPEPPQILPQRHTSFQ